MSLELASTTSEQVRPAVGVIVGERNNHATRFRPGQSGNPGGRPRIARFRREAIKQLKQEVATGVTRLACLIDNTIENANSDVAAATFLRDTVDGKPGSVDGAGNGPTNITIEIAFVGGS